ncbi:anti-phage dCTP deaminase [Novosphingobium aquiterrae]|uniref:Anti-phage dCTP deaminase n=1 Tax=Novosphingobium aquiterrae TaxID=624388 RepID=A0ABV6PDN9_9SPHN
MATQPKKAANDENRAGVAKEILERLSNELVFALVGPLGSGVSMAAELIREKLTGPYQYECPPILKPSDVIREKAPLIGAMAPKPQNSVSYVSNMQDLGNELRSKYGNNYLIEKTIEKMYIFRKDKGGYEGDVELPGRRAYIIDSIKHKDELDLLRSIYGDSLCVIGVFAPDQIRNKRLQDLGFPEEERVKVMDRDQGEVLTFGQDTRNVFVEADFFICNDRREMDVSEALDRFLELIFDISVRTPTLRESTMYEAESASAKSACMSRQVGASIVSSNGELIAIGWNDVPKFGGGLYNEDDRRSLDMQSKDFVDRDFRCHNWAGGVCHNDQNKERIIKQVVENVAKIEGADIEKKLAIEEAVAKSDVKSLIEFSRSIHAEMEAILSVAREGKHSLVGATLFTNTYPCHNCARHIVAAGIKEVVYIKPYKKSLALRLHYDAITEIPDEGGKVLFRQYDGVAPSIYFKIFLTPKDRKDGGKIVRRNRWEAVPVFRVPLDAKRDYEDKVIADLAQKEQVEGG